MIRIFGNVFRWIFSDGQKPLLFGQLFYTVEFGAVCVCMSVGQMGKHNGSIPYKCLFVADNWYYMRNDKQTSCV